MSNLSRRVRRRGLAAIAVTGVALVLLPALVLATPDLAGSWQFVPERSDDVRAKIVASLGSGHSQGDIREDSPRVWIRAWLLQQADAPVAQGLTIEQNANEFKSGLGDEVRTYYFGREATRQGPGGGLRKATVRWDGERLVVEERAVKGSGHIVETYELQPDGHGLLVVWRLEHKAMSQPLELRLAFEKAAR